MSQLGNRPFIGSFALNRTLVRHVPDAIVMINGSPEFATCPSCTQRLNVNKYITQISVDATTDSISTANLTLSVPKHAHDIFGHDGNYILQTNLELVIFIRGYFPMKGFGSLGQDSSNEEGFDADQVPLYPYYQVFRGVVTNVTHDYSGGFYSVTIQAANLLHFWQNLKLSVNGSVFGQRPSQSMVEPSLIGHKFSGANPYAIIYTLVKVGFGAAFGVDFVYAQNTNIRATDDTGKTSLFKHAAQWWEKRWTEHSGNLRMYGIDGTIFNAFEQAYLGRWYDTRSTGEDFAYTSKQVFTALKDSADLNPARSQDLLKKARELGYDPYSLNAAVYSTESGLATEDILRMQAFVLDIGKLGAVNLFETEYMSKLEIAEAVKSISGYEFYQDVDGDLVFKPPMYNLDTRADPVFCIADRDLISISETETEPEATMMKGTGSHFTNVAGHGVDGWLGVGAVYIDYRLVAKYGYREESFESNYMTSRQALFVSAMNRLDLANAGTKSASITIPIRPELRPGYPVYIESLECFYYVKSLSHSISFGGQCTTTINGIAKRSKWLPPMDAPEGGQLPSISNVRLDAPGEYPQMPIYAFPQYLSGDDGGSAGPPRIVGFPNVILALDPAEVNLDTVDITAGALTAEAYIQMALNSGFLERGTDDETFLLRTSNEGEEQVQLSTLQTEWAAASEAIVAGTYIPESDSTLGRIIRSIQQRTGSIDVPNARGLINYLALQTSLKSMFQPGATISGRYRYYSCSHPIETHQAPGNLYVNQEDGTSTTLDSEAPNESFSGPILRFSDVGNGKGVKAEMATPTRGIKIGAYSQKENGDLEVKTEIVRTADIRFVTFGPQLTKKKYDLSVGGDGKDYGSNFRIDRSETIRVLSHLLESRIDSDASKTCEQRFSTEYDRLYSACATFAFDVSATSSEVQTWAASVASVGDALDNKTSLSKGSAAKVLVGGSGIYKKKSDNDAASAIAKLLATALWGYINAVMNSAYKSVLSAMGAVPPTGSTEIREDGVQNTFGPVRRNADGSTRVHQGIDYSAIIGTDLQAVSDGVVYGIGNEGDYGLTLTLELDPINGQKFYAFYAHLSSTNVSVGSRVTKGTTVAKSGETGNAEGLDESEQHIHFELRTSANPGSGLSGRVDPRILFDESSGTSSPDFVTLMTRRNSFLETLTEGSIQFSDTDPGKTYFFSSEYRDTPDWTPIFPVSDAGGYEVFGNLPYGRGVNIEKYAELIQSSTTGDATVSGVEASETSTTLVGTTGGSNASSLSAIEKFFAAYLVVDDVSTIFSSDLLSSTDKAAVLATFNTTESGLQAAVEMLAHQDSSQNAKIRNSPVTSFFRGQSTTGTAAAGNLAALDVGSEFCVCRGADAGLLLSAYSEEYIDLYENPDVDVPAAEAYTKGLSWEVSRDAMAGRALTTRTNLAEQFTAAGDLASDYASSTQSAVSQIKQAADAARSATDRLKE